MNHIEAHNICLRYADHQVLNDLTIGFEKHTITALVGPSGCGKTSFLYCLNRLIEYFDHATVSGQVFLNSENIFESGVNMAQLRRKASMIFQKPSPFPLSIYQNFALPLKEMGIKSRRDIFAVMQKALTDVGLWAEFEHKTHESAVNLSGGQQQRLCLARSLALEPEILLLDEPCSALDPLSVRIIENLLLDLAKSRTIIIVTHNLAQARRIADRVVLFWNSSDSHNIVEDAPAEEFFRNPKSSYARAYVQEEPLFVN